MKINNKSIFRERFKSIFVDNLSAVRIKNSDVNAMSIVKNGVFWVKVFVRLLNPIGLSVTGPRVRAIVVILRKISKICVSQGIKGAVLHLKAASVCLAQASGDHMIKNTGKLNCRISRTNKGVPRLILSSDRALIRKGNLSLLKFYMTVFGLYRVLEFQGKLDSSTIEEGFTGDEVKTERLIMYIQPFVKALKLHGVFGVDVKTLQTRYGIFSDQMISKSPALDWLKKRYEGPLGLWISKSAPGTHKDRGQVSTHPMILIRSAITIIKSEIGAPFSFLVSLLPFNSTFRKAFEASVKLVGIFKPLWSLGKIGIKEEAAGKVRLFAMVSAWYQMLLKPIHDMLFEILKSIPQDGTFDQLRPLRNHFQKYSEAYSLDLTAATDRLPLSLQQALLGALLSKEIADAWGSILTKIEYQLSSLDYNVNKLVKYAVGQPMGALSSWASLALTHHFLVQAAAWESRAVPVGTWFRNYAILGDDLVIFDRKVAMSYLNIINYIGMKVGLHKSLLSRNKSTLTVEFAKRLFHKGVDISPVPIIEFASALFSFGNIMEFQRKYGLSLLQLAKVLGFRYQALAKLNSAKFSSLNYKLKMLMVASQVPTTEEGANSLLELGKPSIPSSFRISTNEILKNLSLVELGALLTKLDKIAHSQLNDKDSLWNLGDILTRLVTPPRSEKELAKGWFGHVSGKLLVPIEPLDSNLWYTDSEATDIPGPAELKEIGKGWNMVFEPGDKPLFRPWRYEPSGLRERMQGLPGSLNAVDMNLPIGKQNLTLLDLESAVDPGLIPEATLRTALAALVDLLVIPQRVSTMDLVTEVRVAILDPRVSRETVASALVHLIENAREASLVPSVIADLVKHSVSARNQDLISMKLWKRWSPIVQRSVSMETHLESMKKLNHSPSKKA